MASEESLSTSEAEEDASHLDALAAFLLGLVLDRLEEAGAEVVGACRHLKLALRDGAWGLALLGGGDRQDVGQDATHHSGEPRLGLG